MSDRELIRGYRKERLKTILIVVLFFTMLALLLLNLYTDQRDFTEPLFDRFLADPNPPAAASDPLPDLSAPVAAALRREGVLQGAAYDSVEVGQVYDLFRSTLGMALSSAQNGSRAAPSEWASALQRDCVYFSFLCGQPVWLLTEGLSYAAKEELDPIMVERLLLLSAEDGSLLLLIHTGSELWLFETALRFELPGADELTLPAAQFAVSLSLPGTVPPDTLFVDTLEARPVAELRQEGLEDAQRTTLLERFGFNPNTNARYTDANGDWVYVDEQRTLHIGQDGLISYADASDAAGETVNDRQAVRLALSALPQGAAFWGEGSMSFLAISSVEESHVVTLAYLWNGAPVEGSEAVYVVSQGRLREARLQVLPLYAAEDTQSLMPQRQATLLLPRGTRLTLAYTQDSDTRWLPSWQYHKAG